MPKTKDQIRREVYARMRRVREAGKPETGIGQDGPKV